MVLTRTPFRISFFGGGTDYPVWFEQHGGALLATAIDKYCYVSCRYLPPFFGHRSRIAYHRIETVDDNAQIEQPVVRACLQFLNITSGVEIHYDADLPGRTGLGTSSAFSVGLLQALYTMQHQARQREALARDAIRVEQDLLAEAVGVQDQITTAFGGFNRIDLRTDGGFTLSPVCAPAERIAALERNLFLYFTGFTRTASLVARHQVENTVNRSAELSAMRDMVDEGWEILHNPRRPIDDFGDLLRQAWQLKRRLSDRVSTPAVDAIYEHALQVGARGGKLLGAGGGGFILFYVDEDRQAAFMPAMSHLLQVPFRFSHQGSQVMLYEAESAYRLECAQAVG